MSEPIPVLTLWQPHASLCFLINPATGLPYKGIETRGWSTKYRGPIALHAGRQVMYGPCGEFGVGRSAEGGVFLTWRRGEHWYELLLPLGAIIGTVTLVDVAPIGGPYSFRTGIVEGDEGDQAGCPVVVHHEAVSGLLPESLILDTADTRTVDITDQLPYGDFEPGRYAWLLADAKALPEPVPFKGGQRLIRKWTPCG